jgi:hypothetical protein
MDAKEYTFANPVSKVHVEIAECILPEWRYQLWISQKF